MIMYVCMYVPHATRTKNHAHTRLARRCQLVFMSFFPCEKERGHELQYTVIRASTRVGGQQNSRIKSWKEAVNMFVSVNLIVLTSPRRVLHKLCCMTVAQQFEKLSFFVCLPFSSRAL